jgi:hypothetical protein
MRIEISNNTLKKIDDVSKLLGIRKKNLIERALLFYMDSIQKQLELKKEMKMWDKLSDESTPKSQK